MSFWTNLIGLTKSSNAARSNTTLDASRYAFVDSEVGMHDGKVHDIGAVRHDGTTYHKPSKDGLINFLNGIDFVCGHNIIHHDAKYLFGDKAYDWELVDTLFMSPLLFPERPYHKLVKNDKLISDQINNPVNDCEKARDLLFDEINQWKELPEANRQIFTSLLYGKTEFKGFLQFVGASTDTNDVANLIKSTYTGKLCQNAALDDLISKFPCELAYALAIINTSDHRSVTPAWVLHNYPEVEHIISLLCNVKCAEGCEYCNRKFDIHYNLKTFFGYDNFRTYEGEPLQEQAAQAALDGKSLLAIFPTGGGKSLTFQLPAIMANRAVRGLTVVISPLQSLMKDQVDNLAEKGISDAVTINGLLDPISRADAYERVSSGDASILYISPESLRSKTIERILLARNVVRFVIDEAHCFSAWGQDFRVDYLYIGRFIHEYQQKKRLKTPIAVSCFTATAKQKVIRDICDYFNRTLGVNLTLYASKATRTNLHYSVIHTEDNADKYQKLRNLITESDCPTIVYVSRTKRTIELAKKLTRDGHPALPFNGQMDPKQKTSNQDAFMSGKVNIIVATSAFGMGVDKKDVGLVVHYDISDSLENYVQEAGRAGRDPNLNARCYVLYGDGDLDKHFILLNQTKLSISEIQQIWTAVKRFSKQRSSFSSSALEIARQAGWDDSVSDIETRVRTALATLEQGGYIERGTNVPHVYATGITVKNLDEARSRITASALFERNEIENAVRIIKSLITNKNTSKTADSEAESRVDYLADILGIKKADVVNIVERMRQEGILADSKDISAFLLDTGNSQRKANNLLEYFAKLERYIINEIPDGTLNISCKQLNDNAVKNGIPTSKEKDIRTLLYFLTIKGYTHKVDHAGLNLELRRVADIESTVRRVQKRLEISRIAIDWLYQFVTASGDDSPSDGAIQFSVIELVNHIRNTQNSLFENLAEIQIEDVEEALLYLSKIGALKLEGGFLVLYNAMNIKRLKPQNTRYKIEDYRMLDAFYKQKIQQVHIVGEYANLMVRDYDAALNFVQDYFQMDYKRFIAKYFKGERITEIDRNISPEKYAQLFGQLSKRQKEIITDKESHCIVVAAGPGSGKTRVLVHKLASLLLLEDVKHEQLLMLTFSRAAATEFKQRLIGLIGNAANFVKITTFHSYCFDLLGRIGNLDDAENVVAKAAEMINQGEVEPSRIGKTVLVIDEAQDMGKDEYELVKAMMANNEDMRVIAVGDDDQNIFEFRGSSSEYMFLLAQGENSRFFEMTENYRSSHRVVNFANHFAKNISERMKSSPITAVRDEEGLVEITIHTAQLIYQPVVEHVLKTKGSGKSCVLTQTNEEAAIVMGLLRRHNIHCTLIQSMNGLRFCNIAEVKYFMRHINERRNSPIISDEVWENAKHATYVKYQTSLAYAYLNRCLTMFEQTNEKKYYSDFWDFIFESSVEDFCDIQNAEVVVSTIHKSKGHEFDNVFMLLTGNYHADDVLMRRYYVGITRAKNNLFIHTNSHYFDRLPADSKKVDYNTYKMPEEIVLQLTHKDVYLGFFKPIKEKVLDLRSGDRLSYDNYLLCNPKTNHAVAKLSEKMQKNIDDWTSRGYEVMGATVRFIVAWKPKDAPKEEPSTAVLLADLSLKKVHDETNHSTEPSSAEG